MGLGSWASPRQRSWRSGRSGRSAMLPNCSVESSAQMAWSTMKHSKILKISEMHHGSWLFRFIQLFMAIHGRIFFWIFMLFSFFLFQGTASYDLHLDCHGLIKYPHEKSGKKVEDEEGWWDSALFSIDRWINRTWPLQGSFSHAGHGHFMWPFRMPGMIAGWLRVTWSNCFLRSRDRRCSLATWVLSQSYIDDRW